MLSKKIILIIFSFVFAVLSAVGSLYSLAHSSLRFDNPLLTTFGIKKNEIVGFLPYWLLDKADKDYSKFITTLTYFGLSLKRDGTLMKLVNPQEEEPGWTTLKSGKFTARAKAILKHDLKKSLLVISGEDEIISNLINNPVQSANNLMSGVAPIMKDQGFTDLNLDIESFMAASESARQNFTTFVQTVKKRLVEQKLGTLTVDLIPIALVKEKLYDAVEIGKVADRVVLMTYDYHYSGSFTAGAVAPVGGEGISLEYDVQRAVKEALKAIPREKILLGIPLYGYEWETIDGQPESATIPGGSSTASVRRIAEILENCATCSAQMDTLAKEPYLIYPENNYFNQIYYENEVSLKEKVTLATKYHLGGVALWALGYEDQTLLSPLSDYKKAFEILGFSN